MQKQKLLLVGGAGYIGGATYDLAIEKYDVTIYDNLLFEGQFLKPCNFIYGDIRDTQKLVRIANEFDIIVFLAALVGDPACEVDRDLTQEINYESVKRFTKGLNPGKKLIFTSTCSVYGAQDDLLDETSPIKPLSAYARTKFEAEKHVKKYGGLIFRLGTVYGKGDNFSRIRFDLVVNALTLKACTTGKIMINGGRQWRPIISVKDVAAYIIEACENYTSDIFVLKNENIILADLGQRVAECIPDTEIIYNDIPFEDLRNYHVNNQKSLNFFNHKPQFSIEDEVTSLSKLILEQRITNYNDSFHYNGKHVGMNHDFLITGER